MFLFYPGLFSLRLVPTKSHENTQATLNERGSGREIDRLRERERERERERD